jgi:hypothetical protein
MSQIGDLLAEYLGQPRKQGEPSMLAPASVQAAYQSSRRTGAPAPDAVPLPNTGDAAYLQPETQPSDKPQMQAPALQPVQQTTEQVVFPEDKWKAQVQSINQKRQQALGLIQDLAMGTKEGDPEIKGYYEMLNEKFPKQKEDFSEADPVVKETASSLRSEHIKISKIASMLSSQLAIADQKKPDGTSQTDWDAQLVRELGGTFLKVVNGVMGTSDAVSQAEVSRLMNGATSKNFDFGRLNEKGQSIFNDADLKSYKKMITDTMHSMQSTANDQFNGLAKVSSPEFATRALGGQFLTPYAGKLAKEVGTAIPVTHRISREKPVVPSKTAPEAQAVRTREYSGGQFRDRNP